MAFDGAAVACIRDELDKTLTGGYITKIAQPEKDELIFTIKNNGNQYRLLISANPSLPLAYITETNKQSPLTAPMFCMLLRKHIGSGKIVSIEQPSLERVLMLNIEHRNELGDLCIKTLVIELMGKHSNIIFINEDKVIIDAIRKISVNVSSVREVLPGRDYFITNTLEKIDPFTVSEDDFKTFVFGKPMPVQKAIYTSVTGFSPALAAEICVRGGLNPDKSANDLSDIEKTHIFSIFSRILNEIRSADFHPSIKYENNKPIDFTVIDSQSYAECPSEEFESISSLLAAYYSQKDIASRIRQKSTDLRKLVSTLLERNVKKLQLQQKQLKDTEKREKYKVYGELINTYGYSLEKGASSLTAINYYDGKEIEIPLDKDLSAKDNAKKYFERYNKLKRTNEAVTLQIKETTSDIEHLESIQTALSLALDEADLTQISDELKDYGYINKKSSDHKKKQQAKAKPLHFISSTGHHIYVGKNNYQNDMLTFATPVKKDWWFHSKGIPGAHVVVKSDTEDLPDIVFEEAGRLAAFYSKAGPGEKVEIDYTLRSNVKKPNGSKPGFVIYYTNYSLIAEPDITGIEQIKD